VGGIINGELTFWYVREKKRPKYQYFLKEPSAPSVYGIFLMVKHPQKKR
jgi:hypothetical protein